MHRVTGIFKTLLFFIDWDGSGSIAKHQYFWRIWPFWNLQEPRNKVFDCYRIPVTLVFSWRQWYLLKSSRSRLKYIISGFNYMHKYLGPLTFSYISIYNIFSGNESLTLEMIKNLNANVSYDPINSNSLLIRLLQFSRKFK